MQVNLNQAVQTLRDVDKQIRDLGKQAAQTASQGQDIVELSTDGGDGDLLNQVQGSIIQSPTSGALLGELSQQLEPLLSLIGGDTSRQSELSGLFGDPNQTDEVQARAQELLEGYFNVENTASRIFDFAFSFYSGGDRAAFAEEMRGNIAEGFRQAEQALGGLADISLETRDRIDEKINEFIEAGEPQTEVQA